MTDTIFNLQLFGEGGAGAAGGDGGAAAGAGGTTGVQAPDAGERRQKRENPLANVRYGRQPEAPKREVAAPNAEAANTGSDKAERIPYEQIRREYKEDIEAEVGTSVQTAIRERFKKSKAAEDTLNSLTPALEALGKLYDVDHTDIGKLVEAIEDDDRLYEDEAAARGMDTKTVKQVERLKRANERLKAAEQQNLEDRMKERHYANLLHQAEQVKQVYPSFDLEAELKNPVFFRLTSMNGGIDVHTAYRVVHEKELKAAENQRIAQQSAAQVANSVRANGMRPAENGLTGQQGASVIKTDPKTLTKADRAEIRRRVARGEKIVF